ncbi:MAG: putative serine/threonine protein kinase [Ilumatobacteraceae bacterium]|nr:putative serine/threonine protein kinase [Ilumatobacteraceae bacterium]
MLAQRYRLERRLAQGGMAEVWLATDTLLSRHVAVKLLKPALAADPVVAERFRREAIAVAGLNHPNIVAVYDSIAEGGRQAVVMQLVNGKSLRQLLDEQKKLSPDLTMHIGVCVASALDAAHIAGLVHRDVKPGNILITPDGRVLLTDFGIAKGLAAAAGDDLTSDNIMMGTAKYLSPEQVRGRKLDGRADLYSLGLVLYECLAGRVPFLGETDADTALARLNRDPTDLARLRPTLPYGLAPLIHRLLARRPEDRLATGAMVKAELARVASRVNDPTASFTPPRGDTAPTPSRGTPVVSGRPPAPVSGFQPVRQGSVTAASPTTAMTTGSSSTTGSVRTGRPAGAAVRVDRTPPSSSRPRQQPNRQFEQRGRVSLVVVGGLLLIALVVGLVLWATAGPDARSGTGAGASTTVGGDASTTVAPPATGIASLILYDPDGDGTEQSTNVPRADDGNAATAWTTVCYADRFLGGKSGLGLVADLGEVRSGTLTVDIASGPYQVQVLSSSDDQYPTAVSGWAATRKFANTSPETITANVTNARWVAVVFNELGQNGSCTRNRYRGQISELSFQPG